MVERKKYSNHFIIIRALCSCWRQRKPSIRRDLK